MPRKDETMSPNKGATDMTPALLVRLNEAKRDRALQTRGDRKLLVTEVYAAKEEEATDIEWRSQTASGKCPVQLMRDTESAVFTRVAKQTRHYHKLGTEIYLVLEGSMMIEVERVDYSLKPGDMIVVNPGAFHQVRREGRFLCRVVTVNCGGAKDRYEQ